MVPRVRTGWETRLRLLAVLLLLVLIGCTSRRSPSDSGTNSQLLRFDDPIILAYSDPILPQEITELASNTPPGISPAAPSSAHIYMFDFSEDSLVTSGRCNDILIKSYPICGGDSVDIWDNEEERWRQFTWNHIAVCIWQPAEAAYMLSSSGVSITAALNDDHQMLVRGPGFYYPRPIFQSHARALEVNAKYKPKPNPAATGWGRAFLTMTNDALYYTSWNVSPDNYMVTAVYRDQGTGHADLIGETSMRSSASGVAVVDNSLWVAEAYRDSVVQISIDGDILCGFPAPTEVRGPSWNAGRAGPVASDGARLWLYTHGRTADLGQTIRAIHVIDIAASCAIGRAVVDTTFTPPGGTVHGIDWDGEALLIVTDKLYRTTATGEVIGAYDLPVLGVHGVASLGDSISFICQGPPNPENRPLSEYPIVTFKTPWTE